MGFDVADIARIHVGRLQRIADHVSLGEPVRYGEPSTASVLVDRGAADEREDAIAVGERMRQPLEHDHAARLPHAQTRRRDASNVLQRPSGASMPHRDRESSLGDED